MDAVAGAGDAVLYDYRVLHRGLPNTCEALQRDLLQVCARYACVAHDFLIAPFLMAMLFSTACLMPRQSSEVMYARLQVVYHTKGYQERRNYSANSLLKESQP